MPPGPPIGPLRGLISLRAPRIFAHFFDVHFLAEKNVDAFPRQAFDEARLAFRLALLLSDEVLVPASSQGESELCRRVLGEFDDGSFANHVSLIASATNFEEFLEDKKRQYGAREKQGRIYREMSREPAFPWRDRTRSATLDIAADWRSTLERNGFDRLVEEVRDLVSGDVERRIEEAHERLEGRAFIAGNVLPIIFGKGRPVPMPARNRVLSIINAGYFGSYAADPEAAIVKNLRWLASSREIVSRMPEHDVDYRGTVTALRKHGVLELVEREPGATLLAIRDDERFVAAMSEVAASTPRPEALKGYYALSTPDEPAPPVAPRAASTILVMTALPEELAAVRATLDHSEKVGDEQGNIYFSGTYIDERGLRREILVGSLTAMGKANAAVATANALRTFPSVRHVVMCGIAGGCPAPERPDDHVRLGDIVASTAIFEHDHVKATSESVEHRSHPQNASHALIQALNALSSGEDLGERPWEGVMAKALAKLVGGRDYSRPPPDMDVLEIDGEAAEHPARRRPGHPVLHRGVVATGDTLLKDSKRRDELRDRFKVRAIEMEGSAVQNATWADGVDAMVVRGISDYCDGRKGDRWRFHAALAAAAFTRSLVEETPIVTPSRRG